MLHSLQTVRVGFCRPRPDNTTTAFQHVTDMCIIGYTHRSRLICPTIFGFGNERMRRPRTLFDFFTMQSMLGWNISFLSRMTPSSLMVSTYSTVGQWPIHSNYYHFGTRDVIVIFIFVWIVNHILCDLLFVKMHFTVQKVKSNLFKCFFRIMEYLSTIKSNVWLKMVSFWGEEKRKGHDALGEENSQLSNAHVYFTCI